MRKLVVLCMVGLIVVASGAFAATWTARAQAEGDGAAQVSDSALDFAQESQRLSEMVSGDGFEVKSVSVTGRQASIHVRQLTAQSDQLLNVVQLEKLYRRAAFLGITSLHVKLERSDGTAVEQEKRLNPSNVVRGDANEAAEAVAEWVSSVAKAKDVEASVAFDPVEYQADVTVSGPSELLSSAVEAFMNGGRGLHEPKGYVEVVTVRAIAGDRVVFEGLADWVVDIRVRVSQAPDLQVEY